MQPARLLRGILAATMLAVAVPVGAADAAAGTAADAVADGAVRTSARPAVDYAALMRATVDGLIASQQPDGLFPYGFDFLADQPLEPGRLSPENLIRQAGTASALAEYYLRTHDPRLRQPLARLLEAFGRHSLPIG
ncbi:MAG: hypothetical protein ACM3QY_09490, partial [Candidatus Levyibacteriota bacterium]